MNGNSAPITAWLFPGQGSQSLGMGRSLLAEFSPAREVLAMASEMVGRDLAAVIARGPDALLTRTDNLQPAITAINLGCCLLLREAGVAAHAVAGHSLGEFSALFAAGVLSLHDALWLTVERGRLMHQVSATLDGGMLAVKAVPIGVIEAAVSEVARDFAVGIANYNTPSQTVISGEREGLARIAQALSAAGGQAVALNVSGPWHSPLLRPAAERFVQVLRTVHFHDAAVPVVMNASGKAASTEAALREQVEAQLCSPVRWWRTLQTLGAMGTGRFVEVGPGKVLRGLLRGLPELAEHDVVNVEGPKSLAFLGVASVKLAS